MIPSATAGGGDARNWDWSLPGRPTRIFVDLDAIAGNVRFFRDSVTPGTAIMAVVKADGYGHGAAMVAREAVSAGASSLAVATVDEGVALRGFGIEAPILVLGPIDPSEAPLAVRSTLALTISDPGFVNVVAQAVRSVAGVEPLSVHVKVDTGMNRFGASPGSAIAVCRSVNATPELRLAGFYSHLADADNDADETSVAQGMVFDACLTELANAEISPGTVHLSNSAAALRWRRFDHDMVRVGIALYGLSPSPGMVIPAQVRPALGVRSRVAKVSDLVAGDAVSYGGAYVARRSERVALVPIGYADGYRRGLSGKGVMVISGHECVVRGRVCMDQTVIGTPEGFDTRVGDEIDVVSAKRGSVNSVSAIAAALDTIDYEVVTQLARRIPRYYTRGRRVVAVQDLHAVDLTSDEQ